MLSSWLAGCHYISQRNHLSKCLSVKPSICIFHPSSRLTGLDEPTNKVINSTPMKVIINETRIALRPPSGQRVGGGSLEMDIIRFDLS